MSTLLKFDPREGEKFARQVVRELGFSLSGDAENELAATVAGRLHVDPAGPRLVVVDDAGAPMVALAGDGTVTDLDPTAYVGQLAAAQGLAATSKGSATVNMTARAVAANAARKSADARKQLAAEEAARGPNPWSARHLNRSRQGLISNLDPDLAQRMKQEARVR